MMLNVVVERFDYFVLIQVGQTPDILEKSTIQASRMSTVLGSSTHQQRASAMP
jgi:hypothetical protein